MLPTADGVDREAIQSSNLVSIGYSVERQVCAVEFKSGLILHYSGVPLDVAGAFYCAESRGAFYSKNIRGKYTAIAMTGPCTGCQVNGVVGETCAACGGTHVRTERRYDEPSQVQVDPPSAEV